MKLFQGTKDGVPVNLGRQTKVNIEISNMTIPTTELQEDAVSGTGMSNTPIKMKVLFKGELYSQYSQTQNFA